MATPPAPHQSDAYEREHMSAAPVLYRDKFTAPRTFNLIMLGCLLVTFIPPLIPLLTHTFDPVLVLVSLLSALPILVIWAMFMVLRVAVNTEHVHVQLGLFGPKIPIADILSCEATTYDWKKFGGWGIRRSFDGEWAYNMMGDAGRAVRLRYREGARERTIVVTAQDPEALASAVHEAQRRARLPAATDAASRDDEAIVLELEPKRAPRGAAREDAQEDARGDAQDGGEGATEKVHASTPQRVGRP